MNTKKMVPRHSICGTELLIRFYSLTDEHSLLMEGLCPRCKVKVDLFLSLTQLYTDCPDPPAVFTVADVCELKAMCILLPEPPLLSA